MTKVFVKELKEKTNGQYDAKLFLNSQLGSEEDTINDVSMGLLDFSVVAINNITPFSPTLGVFTLPYVVQSVEDAVTLTQSAAAEKLVENTVRDSGTRIVGWTFSGFRVFTNSKRPVKSLADLQGLVVRVPKNEIMIDTYKAWGVNPTPMSWSEVFTALQLKVVDGQDLSIIDINSARFYEVQKYLTPIHYNFLIEPIIMSESLFQEQSPEVQQAIIEAGKAATLASERFLKEQEALALENLKERGMEIDELDEAEWIKIATEKVWPKYYDSVGGKDQVNEVLQALGREQI
ncbi:TRAP transporter substrate-binding protein [Pseudomonas sp. MS19]|uniref:TRAP transporter substrate-binding protein n=1 Tax=Pseudomonas sp. MS19 TaxID=2579939 RepID=UPI001F5B5391|nr:TRAP transporter substrate-binding protein [Pseudomonas sp. MS19]